MILKHIAESTGLKIDYLRKVVNSASHRYKVYEIPKKTEGFRKISHPSGELKFLQTWLVDNIFIHLPVHKSVLSYRRGKNILNLANLHKKNNFLLKVDFADFFPSIKSDDIVKLLEDNMDRINMALSHDDLKTVCSIVCRYNHLTIGAPSSPIISNTILYKFDELCFKNARTMDVIYSRYADDIYFSTSKPKILEVIFSFFKDTVKELESPRLTINDTKTVFTSRKHKRIVTGLFLTSDNKISIGRSKKRYIKSLVHQYRLGDIHEDELSYLQGYLAYINSVEPEFILRMREKYGDEIISSLLSANFESKKEY